MSNNYEDFQRTTFPISNNAGDMPEGHTPFPTRTNFQQHQATYGTAVYDFDALYKNGGPEEIDPRFRHTTDYPYTNQDAYNKIDPQLRQTSAQQTGSHGNRAGFVYSETRSSIDSEHPALPSTTDMMENAIASVEARYRGTGINLPPSPKYEDNCDFAYQNNQPGEMTRRSVMHYPLPAQYEQLHAAYGVQYELPSGTTQVFVQDERQIEMNPHQYNTQVGSSVTHSSPLVAHDIENGHMQPVLELYDQPYIDHRAPVQLDRLVEAASHGYPRPPCPQSSQHTGTITAMQAHPGIDNVYILCSKTPVRAQNNARGDVIESQLTQRAPSPAHDNDEKSFMSSFKAEKPKDKHAQTQVDPSKTALISAPTAVAPQVISLKRKDRNERDNDMPQAKKAKAKATEPGNQDQSVDQHRLLKPMKKQKYSALAGVEDTPLPDYSHVSIEFTSRDAAMAAIAQKRAKQLEESFRRDEEDTSIPRNDAERQTAVRTLFGAMKDVSRTKDLNSRAFQSRWAEDSTLKYDDVDIEATCWEIVNLAERLHREGPSALSIRDPNYVQHIKKSAHLTFVQRMRVIATLAMEWKARNDGLIKGVTVQTTVAAPLEALQSAQNNSKANKHRAQALEFAKENQPEQKKRETKGLKGKKAQPKTSNQQVTQVIDLASRDQGAPAVFGSPMREQSSGPLSVPRTPPHDSSNLGDGEAGEGFL